ncbi:MAG: metallophosphoesterase family protein [Cyanobacteria bacterium P01_F01_bin.42]
MSSDSQSTSRTIMIGDVHGHYDGLMKLMDLLAPTSVDRIYFMGDLVDRGPKSCQVVDFVKSQGYSCLRGNHEEMMIAACNPEQRDYTPFQFWSSCGGKETIESYDSPDHLRAHVDWFQTLPVFIDLGHLWLVHAGVHPKKAIEKQTAQEFCWIREAFHQMTTPYFPDKLIVTGHTITFTFPKVQPGQVARGAGWLDIDTGAYHSKSGWLTAYDSTHEQIYQVNVFEDRARIMPLEEAVAPVMPKSKKFRFV